MKGMFYLFSILPIIIIFSYILFPFKFLIYQLRLGVIKMFFKSFFPFGKNGVKFKDIISAGILTSISYPLVSLTVAFCMISCEECRKSDSRRECKRENIAALIVQTLPYFARAMQCMNRAYYTTRPVFFSLYGMKFLLKISLICVSYLTKIGKEIYWNFLLLKFFL